MTTTVYTITPGPVRAFSSKVDISKKCRSDNQFRTAQRSSSSEDHDTLGSNSVPQRMHIESRSLRTTERKRGLCLFASVSRDEFGDFTATAVGRKHQYNHVKNPDSKPLRIKRLTGVTRDDHYALVLSNLAIAQSNLVRAGKDSAMPHFIAIVKELEKMYDFTFEILNEDSGNGTST